MSTWKDLADLIFPDIDQTIADLQAKYPARQNPICSRFAPSPTGFMHIGNFYSAFVSERYAKQNGGTFFLRIEDTDQKREISGAIELIIGNLKSFDINIDEGPIGKAGLDMGNYGPYIQSKRKHIYQVFVKTLIEKGLAYPCWMSEKELEDTRNGQLKSKITPGIYGNYSVWRNKTIEEILQKMKEDQNFVIRFRSHGDLNQRCVFDDVIKGKINMIDNYNDIILIKSDGLPTYHLAHIVDDHLMRVSHIIRGEERLTSVPLHLQLFKAFELTHPKYCHVAPLLKFDEEGNKRKLSKRKDPEANVTYFFENGYASEGIIDYLLTIIDSTYEERQKTNLDKSYLDFEIKIDCMNTSGALFDFIKLQSVNNDYLSRISTDRLFEEALEWAEKYNLELAELMKEDIEYTKNALNIERHTPKDPKRFSTFKDVDKQIRFFYDSQWEKLILSPECKLESFTFDTSILAKFVEEYLSELNLDSTVEEWFDQLKLIGKKYGFAGNNAEFKEGGYIGKIGDLAMFLRMALCASTKTPDLFSVMKVMGKDRIKNRLTKYLA